ncbi:MFS transporter [Nocardia australiensis]|uniref:MFS transporter n=1 Tax=Nocardia australiensis TaxID=2887191 RepID=UPI001D15C769|nr:MFS transporter [Nocardia australiensis]
MSLHSTVAPHALSPKSSRASRIYPWIVFAMVFALLLSDYMSRQVLSAIFPLLKSEWDLSDTRLASLNSAVAVMVGVLTLPLSLLADRWGRIKSVTLMAVFWSIATLLSAAAMNYGQMLAARFLVGVGEAAYGSVGLAVLLSVFAPHMRASLSGAFQAAGSFGSVIGVALGGYIALHLGWRWSFAAMAILGLLLAAMFSVLVTEKRMTRHRKDDTEESLESGGAADGYKAPFRTLFANPSVICAYLTGGLQMFVAAVLLAWLPSYFNRYHDMDLGKAGVTASIFSLLIAIGMICCGIITDRSSRRHPSRKWTSAIAYCMVSVATLLLGFQLAPGAPQMILLGIGAFFAAGSSGAMTAMVANLTHPSVRASGFGTLTLAYSLIGMALGPFAIGAIADSVGLLGALRLAPLVYVAAIICLSIGRRRYPASLRKLAALDGATADRTDR